MPRLPRQTFTTEQELPDHQARFGEQPEPMREMDEESSEDENAVANTGASLSASIPLKAPVPPQFEAAIGYQGDARYVALYWQPAGDEARYNDGHVSGDGDWWAWLAYVEHAAVASHLAQTCSNCDGWGELPDTQQGLRDLEKIKHPRACQTRQGKEECPQTSFPIQATVRSCLHKPSSPSLSA
jgi:hypothetical protein